MHLRGLLKLDLSGVSETVLEHLSEHHFTLGFVGLVGSCCPLETPTRVEG